MTGTETAIDEGAHDVGERSLHVGEIPHADAERIPDEHLHDLVRAVLGP